MLQVFLSTPPPHPPPRQLKPSSTVVPNFCPLKLLQWPIIGCAVSKGGLANMQQAPIPIHSNFEYICLYCQSLKLVVSEKCLKRRFAFFYFLVQPPFLLMYRDRKLASETPNFSFHSCLSVIQCQGGESFSIFGRRSY